MQLLCSSGHPNECELQLQITSTSTWPLFHYCFNHQFVTSLMCRNPEYFNDPDTFDPSRFDAGKSRYVRVYKRNMVTCTKLGSSHRPGPFIYFPFSVGHRSCIGRHFAMVN